MRLHAPCRFFSRRVLLKKIIEEILENKLPNGVCLNVNIPKIKKEEIKGIKTCRQARAIWEEEFEERFDPTGKPYYWLTGKFINFEEEKPIQMSGLLKTIIFLLSQ